MDNISILSEMGYVVDVACNFTKGSTINRDTIDEFAEQLNSLGINYYQVDFARSAVSFNQHIRSVKQVKELVAQHDYSLIHTHGPVSSAIVRWVARNKNIPIVYTVHGFQFLKGGPIKDWLFFYPIEKYLSNKTDMLITLNHEDYNLASRHFHAKQTVFVPGVGVDINKFSRNRKVRSQKRGELGLNDDDIMLFSIGELNHRKNHHVVIRAIQQLKNHNHIQYFIAGQGHLDKELVDLAGSLGLANNVHLLGYRNDIAMLLSAADIFLLPSFREGLAVAGMEAMAAGLPIIGSNARGVADYISDGRNGFVCPADSVLAFKKAIECLISNTELREKQGEESLKVVRLYERSIINQTMRSLYQEMTLKIGEG